MRLSQKDRFFYFFTQSRGDRSANVLIYNSTFLCAFAPLREIGTFEIASLNTESG